MCGCQGTRESRPLDNGGWPGLGHPGWGVWEQQGPSWIRGHTEPPPYLRSILSGPWGVRAQTGLSSSSPTIPHSSAPLALSSASPLPNLQCLQWPVSLNVNLMAHGCRGPHGTRGLQKVGRWPGAPTAPGTYYIGGLGRPAFACVFDLGQTPAQTCGALWESEGLVDSCLSQEHGRRSLCLRAGAPPAGSDRNFEGLAWGVGSQPLRPVCGFCPRRCRLLGLPTAFPGCRVPDAGPAAQHSFFWT